MTLKRMNIFGPGSIPSVLVDEELASEIESAIDEGTALEFRDSTGVRFKIKQGAAWGFSSEDEMELSEIK